MRDVKGFYEHAIHYLVALVLLGILNLWTSPETLWLGDVAMGWGVGLAAHGLSAFEVFNLFGPEWERRQTQRRLRRYSSPKCGAKARRASLLLLQSQ